MHHHARPRLTTVSHDTQLFTSAPSRTLPYSPLARAPHPPSGPRASPIKGSTKKPLGPLHPHPIPDGRGDAIAIDFVGKLPEDQGFDCVATVTDRLGADLRLIPTRTDVTAEAFAALFFDAWYCKNGLPTEIVSDRDTLFVSVFWTALHNLD